MQPNPETRKPRRGGKFYALWFLCWTVLVFIVLGLVLGIAHGPHISTRTAVALAFSISVFVSAVSTLGYWFLYTFHNEKFTLKQQSDN